MFVHVCAQGCKGATIIAALAPPGCWIPHTCALCVLVLHHQALAVERRQPGPRSWRTRVDKSSLPRRQEEDPATTDLEAMAATEEQTRLGFEDQVKVLLLKRMKRDCYLIHA